MSGATPTGCVKETTEIRLKTAKLIMELVFFGLSVVWLALQIGDALT
jgi:hypothetical protein